MFKVVSNIEKRFVKMKKNLSKKLLSATLVTTVFASSLLVGCGHRANRSVPMDTTMEAQSDTVDVSEPSVTDLSQSPATTIMNSINMGWNLGNSFDCCVDEGQRNLDGSHPASFYETAWGNPVVSTDLIYQVKLAGFNTIRIPVTWYYNTYEDENGTLHIQPDWLKRVKDIVEYAITLDMYVILDSHHDAPIFYADENDKEQVIKNIKEVWGEISSNFSGYDEHLLFEGFNELNDKEDSWKATKEMIALNNEYNQVFVDTVRSTGDYNTSRVLVVGTYLNAIDSDTLAGFRLPDDSAKQSLIVSVHYYGSSFDQEIESTFTSLEAFSASVSAPVLITEFGTTLEYSPEELRGTHAANYVARAKGHKLKCIWWDDGAKYSIFDRTSITVSSEDVIIGLMDPSANNVVYSQDVSISNIEQFVYQTIDSESGQLTDSSAGALTLVDDGIGFPVSTGLQYIISLNMKESGDGMRISQVAFYDENGMYLGNYDASAATGLSIQAPENAAYMKLVVYNPWGIRSYAEYEDILSSNDLIITIKEFSLHE